MGDLEPDADDDEGGDDLQEGAWRLYEVFSMIWTTRRCRHTRKTLTKEYESERHSQRPRVVAVEHHVQAVPADSHAYDARDDVIKDDSGKRKSKNIFWWKLEK